MSIQLDHYDPNQGESAPTNGHISLEALQEEQDHLAFRTYVLDLKDSDEYDQATIQEMARAFNETLTYPLSAEEQEKWTGPLVALPQPPQKLDPDAKRSKVLTEAITKRDKKALFTDACIDFLGKMKRLNLLAYTNTLDEIKAVFGKDVSIADIKRLVKQAAHSQELAERGERPDVATIAYHWVLSHRDLWAYDMRRDSWRMYNGMMWGEEREKGSFLDQYAVTALQEAGQPVNSIGALNLFQRVAASHCKRVFAHAKGKVNFQNGTLDLATMQLLPFDRDDNFTYCLPYNYDPYGSHPIIDTCLQGGIGTIENGVFVPDPYGTQALISHYGLALIEDRTLHKAMTALGPPSTGKSIILDIGNLVCGLEPKQYVPDCIFNQELEGKRTRYTFNTRKIACIDEVPSDAFQQEELVKQMISHNGVSMRGLHKEEQEDNSWQPKILMVANDDPHYKDISGAIKRRILIIRMPVRRAEEPNAEGIPLADTHLIDKIRTEIGAFVATCIRYALIVQARGFYPQSTKMKQDLEHLTVAGNPLKSCIEEKFITGCPTDVTPTKVLYGVYREYCQELGNIIPLGSPNFASSICGMGLAVYPKKFRGERCLWGIRLRTDYDPIPSDDDEGKKFVNSSLITDTVDSVDSDWTVKKAGCPLSKGSLQAASQEEWTAWTVDSHKLGYRENIRIDYENNNIILPIENRQTDLPSTLSTEGITPLLEPNERLDSEKNDCPPLSTTVHEKDMLVSTPLGEGRITAVYQDVLSVFLFDKGAHMFYGDERYQVLPQVRGPQEQEGE